jgi:hypothetical protein
MALAGHLGGKWGPVVRIGLPRNAYRQPSAALTGLSCSRPGWCAAVGSYSVTPGRSEALGVIGTGGTWHRAIEISAPARAVASRFTSLTSISCTQRGRCLAAGTYAVSAAQNRAMTVTESRGRFGQATAVTALPRGAPARASTALAAVSCGGHGRCMAAGVASNGAGQFVAAYAVRSGGRWSMAYLAPPADARAGAHEQSSLFSVGCPGAGRCLVAGYYNDRSGGYAAQAAPAG